MRVLAACTAVAGLLLATGAHRRGDELLGVTVCAITGLLTWDHHWVWALPTAIWAAARLPRDLPGRWRLWPGGPPTASLAAIAVLAVYAAIPRHPPVQWPNPGVPLDPDPLLHISGWIWTAPMSGDDGYFWSGTQILTGNLYVFAGLVFLLWTGVYLALLPRTGVLSGMALEDLRPAT